MGRINKRIILLVMLVFITGIFNQLVATHIRAGEIIARRIDNLSFTYEFTFIGYRDTDSGIQFGGGVFDLGDGTVIDGREDGFEITETQITSNIVRAEFKIIHEFQAPNRYVVSYKEDFRNDGISNMDNSVNTSFYTESVIAIDPFFGINNTPILTIPPIDEGTPGVTFIHNAGAFDPDGDSLSYTFTTPKQSEAEDVFNYRELINPAFYNDFATGSASGTPPTLELDPVTGNLIWDSPGDIFNLFGNQCNDCADRCAEYNVAFRVQEWRRVGDDWEPLGYVTRDMQIIVYEGQNEKPQLEIPPDLCVVAGSNIEQNILGSDPDGHDIKIEAFGEPFEVNSPATYSPQPGINDFRPSPAQTQFNWNTVCGHVKARPYEIQLKISDDPNVDGDCLGPAAVDFQQWMIQVIGPKPTGLEAEVASGRSVELDWNNYSCPNANEIEIWRRVGDFEIMEDSCVTGMPTGTGYQLVNTVSSLETSYLDQNLAPGAKYCYRIVATFPEPQGGESIVSDEVCVTIETDAPVVTNVDVRTTAEDGEILVRWTPPYEVDSSTFPPPYTYNLTRSSGQFLNAPEEIAQNLSDTVFIDSGINTDIRSYSYRVALYDGDGNFVDSSAVASSVRLNANPLLQAIEISWQANVPWSIVSNDYPYHYIYRDRVLEGDPGQLVLIDSVEVTNDGLRYFDDGSFNGVQLDKELEYCYFVTTQGYYDNPLIPEPLINRSQSICAQPNDNFAPCPPIGVVAANNFDCERVLSSVGCAFDDYENVIEWRQSENPSCDDDTEFYRIYFSPSGLEEDYFLLDSTVEVSYVHGNLPSFKGCYRISSVDRSGNESELSDPLCIDNCPNFELPNVFTPNNDGINDTFTPFFSGLNQQVEEFDFSKCPRFVEEVKFRVFDRAGKLIFDLQKEEEISKLINWDGRTNDGIELPSGVYYYVADVTFDVLERSDRKRTYKGWVQLMR